MATRDIGLAVITLGGGRHIATDRIDARVGLTGVVQLSQRVERGQPLCVVHAGDEADAQAIGDQLVGLFDIGDEAFPVQPVMVERLLE